MKKEYICKTCKKPFMAREADRKRGWQKGVAKVVLRKGTTLRTEILPDYQNRKEKEIILGDVADAILDGDLCQVCGDAMDDDGEGFPVTCEDCKD